MVTVPQAVVRWLPVILFWSLPLIVPAACAIRLLWERPSPAVEPGYSWLSLPADLATDGAPLDGWSMLERPKAPQESMVEVSPLVDPSLEEPVNAPLCVEIHGHVGKGDSAVYCFFDTREGSWFRLSPGDVDPDRRLALESGEEGIPNLIHLSTGARYRIQPGEQLPQLLDSNN